MKFGLDGFQDRFHVGMIQTTLREVHPKRHLRNTTKRRGHREARDVRKRRDFESGSVPPEIHGLRIEFASFAQNDAVVRQLAGQRGPEFTERLLQDYSRRKHSQSGGRFAFGDRECWAIWDAEKYGKRAQIRLRFTECAVWLCYRECKRQVTVAHPPWFAEESWRMHNCGQRHRNSRILITLKRPPSYGRGTGVANTIKS